MIYTINQLKDKYSDYSNVFEKLKVEENNKRLIKISRGLYTDDDNEILFHIANVLLNPSYISFETALSFYNLIPERVDIVKSASFKKNKIKTFKTELGVFYYQDINSKAYPFGIDTMDIDGRLIFIASKEKALTDTISICSPRNSVKEIKQLLFDDLRINEFVFDQLDKELLIELCNLYPSKNIKLFQKYLRRNNDD